MVRSLIYFLLRIVLHNGEALPPCLFNLALEYGTSKVQLNQKRLKLLGCIRLSSVLIKLIKRAKYMYCKEKKTTLLLAASKAIGLEVTAEKIKCMVMPPEKNTKKSHHQEG